MQAIRIGETELGQFANDRLRHLTSAALDYLHELEEFHRVEFNLENHCEEKFSLSDEESDSECEDALESTEEKRIPDWLPKLCQCHQCRCCKYDCVHCYETDDGETTQTMESSDYDSEDEGQDECEQVHVGLYEKDTPKEQMEAGICLRVTEQGLEILRVAHRETSYYMFWSQKHTEAEQVAHLTVHEINQV